MEFSQTDATNLIISTRRIISSNLQKKKMVRERERKFCLNKKNVLCSVLVMALYSIVQTVFKNQISLKLVKLVSCKI